MQFPGARILIFAKAPVAGRVKTRLIPALGEDGAARLYSRLLRQVIMTLTAADLSPLQCWCTPGTQHPFFHELQQVHQIELRTQIGVDLGERMQSAACSVLRHSEAVILLGGDCPVMGSDYVLKALHFLIHGADAVVGPAEDGGYVLLGIKQCAPELFEDIPWGTAQVLEETRRRGAELGWHWAELEVLWDVDRPEDLKRLRHIIKPYSQ